MPLPHRRAFPDIWISYLDYGAPAVPSIWREILFPKGVCHRSCYPMQFGMFRANLAIPGRPVLEVVAVPVFCEPFPLGGHSRRSLHKVVLCPEVAPIIGFVYLPDIVQKRSNVFDCRSHPAGRGRLRSVHGTSLGLRIYNPTSAGALAWPRTSPPAGMKSPGRRRASL